MTINQGDSMSMTNTERRRERQPREQRVPCARCKALTWAHDRICGACAADALEDVEAALREADDLTADRYAAEVTV